jgi:hypothetical protein
MNPKSNYQPTGESMSQYQEFKEMAHSLGYGGLVDEMLDDNPFMLEAIQTWMMEHYSRRQPFKDYLLEEGLIEEEDEEEQED